MLGVPIRRSVKRKLWSGAASKKKKNHLPSIVLSPGHGRASLKCGSCVNRLPEPLELPSTFSYIMEVI